MWLSRLKQQIVSQSSVLHVYALGICIMCGKQTVKWHQGYALCGFYLFGVVSAVYIIMHTVLTYCFAELISIVPFSGGGYAYSRCSLGPSVGYMAGMVELGKYLLYTVTSVTRVGLIFQDAFGFQDSFLLTSWLLFFVSVNVLHFFDMRFIWVIVGAVGVTTVTFQLLFVLGAVEKGTVTNISASYWESNPQHFLMGFPYAAYLMVSSDAVRTCVDDESKNTVPRALIRVLVWSALIAFATMVSQAAYVHDDAFLRSGAYSYSKGFGIMFPTVDSAYLSLFALPGTIGCSFGFLYCTARQVRSMACSGLLPPILASGFREQQQTDRDSSSRSNAFFIYKSPPTNEESSRESAGSVSASFSKPTLALFVVSVISYALMLIGFYQLKDANTTFTRTGSLFRCIQYWFLMTAYLAFATRFSSMTREIKSPFGMSGAVTVIAFFVMMFVSSLYYDDDSEGQGIMLVFYFVLSMLYYVFAVQKRQFFSKEEQDKFLKAYVVKANRYRRTKPSRRFASIVKDIFFRRHHRWSSPQVVPVDERSGQKETNSSSESS